MYAKSWVVASVLVGLLTWAAGCGHSQPGKTVHGTAEAYKKAEQEKSK